MNRLLGLLFYYKYMDGFILIEQLCTKNELHLVYTESNNIIIFFDFFLSFPGILKLPWFIRYIFKTYIVIKSKFIE